MKFLTLFLLILLGIPVARAADAPSLPRLHVEGNHLVGPDGQQVNLKGVSLCSLEWHNPLGQIEEVTKSASAWNVNVLRLPVQPKEWDRTADAERYIKDRLDPAVAMCKKNGVYCVIDWHEIGDWQDKENVEKLEAFWKAVAPRYDQESNILYEVFNEPTRPGKQSRENWLAWRDKAQPWVDNIRADAPETVILVGSPHWSQMPSFAKDDPFAGKNLMYVMHLYPNWKQKEWDRLFGEASAAIPIFISEWGWSSYEESKKDVFFGNREKFGEPLKAYLDARPQIAWTAWSYDPLCGPAMTGRDKDMAVFVKEWLEQLKKH